MRPSMAYTSQCSLRIDPEDISSPCLRMSMASSGCIPYIGVSSWHGCSISISMQTSGGMSWLLDCLVPLYAATCCMQTDMDQVNGFKGHT